VTAELATAPLAHRDADLDAIAEATNGGLVAVEIPFLTMLDLRVATAIARDRAMLLPWEANTVLREGNRAALWLGPDEWLVVGPRRAAAELSDELERSLTGAHHSVVDVSAARAVLDLSGPFVRDVLAMGCALDLHPTRWSGGMCAQTLLAKAQVILEQLDVSTTRLYVRPSFADYLVDWIGRAVGI
jgi:sarcosine oxidase subunit gamma